MGRESRLKLFRPRTRRPGGPKVVVGYPVGGSVTLAFHASMLRLLGHEFGKPPERRLLAKVTHTSGLYVADNRQMLVRQFMEAEADWLLQIDTDIEFPPTLIETLLGIAGTDREIVAANVPLGSFPTVAFMRTDRPGIWDCVERLEVDVVECDAVATAILMTHRRVFEAIAARHGRCWFQHLYIPNSPEGTPLPEFEFMSIGEDIAFCLRVKEAGFKVYAARVPGLRHHKTRALSADFDCEASNPGGGAVGGLVHEEA